MAIEVSPLIGGVNKLIFDCKRRIEEKMGNYGDAHLDLIIDTLRASYNNYFHHTYCLSKKWTNK